MTTSTDSVATEAEQIRNQLDSTARAIKADADLTPEARRRRMAEAHADAKQRMDQLRTRVRADANRSREEAAARLVGGDRINAGVDAISIRDASERASRLESAGEAKQLLRRARLNGDETLVRAILFEAQERSGEFFIGHHWGELLREEARNGGKVAADIVLSSDGVEDDGSSSFADIGKYLLPSLSDLTYDLD